MEKQTTEIGKSYWNNDGVYQKELKSLEELVPSSGRAFTVNGELVRVVSRLFHEFCNNGNMNALDRKKEECPECGGGGYEDDSDEDEEPEDCHWCGGDCTIDGDVVIDGMFLEFINFIEETVPTASKQVEDLKAFLLDKDKGYSNYTFEDDEMRIYNALTDEVLYFVLNNENKSL